LSAGELMFIGPQKRT